MFVSLRGADFSKWNLAIDFKRVRPQIDFAILRATNGPKITDPYFLLNAKGCHDVGLPWGAYHFFHFLEDTKAQSDRFIKTVRLAKQEFLKMPLFLDVETNEKKLPIPGKKLVENCFLFLSELKNAGFDQGLYMSPGFSWFLPKDHGLGIFKLWAADFTGSINPINGWKKPYMHQYTETGKLNGVKGNVDLNRTL